MTTHALADERLSVRNFLIQKRRRAGLPDFRAHPRAAEHALAFACDKLGHNEGISNIRVSSGELVTRLELAYAHLSADIRRDIEGAPPC